MNLFNQFVTLKKKDPLFQSFLWGKVDTIDKDKVILPIETLNLDSTEETVTFKIIDKKEIQKPSAFIFISQFIKLRSYILILIPLFFVLTKNILDDRFRDPFSVFLASVGMLFLFAAMNIRNDISDHISGFDRVNFTSAAKPISSGWITAARAAKISWILIFISAFIAWPAFLLQKELIRVLLVVLVLFYIGQLFSKNSYKQKRHGEVILFLLAGAGLSSGYQVSLGGGVDTEVLAFGIFWGFAVLFLIHINNFSHLLTSSQAKIQNTITKMGFDKAQRFLVFWWIMTICLFAIFHWLYASLFWTWFGTILLVFCSIPLFIKIYKIRSPLGSDLQNIRKEAHLTFLLMVAILFFENLSYLGTKLNW